MKFLVDLSALAMSSCRLVLGTLRSGVVACAVLSGLVAAPAHAAHMGLSFALDFVGGPIAGETAIGTMSFDCSAICDGLFTPSGPDNFLGPTGTLLGFSIVVGGVSFTALGDDAYPDFPIITLDNNTLERIEFQTFGPPTLSIFGGPLDGGGSFTNADFDTSQIGAIRQIGAIQPVPEPSEALLMAAGLIAVLSARRRRALR